MRILISRLLAFGLLVGVTATVSAQTSLRFTGNAVPDQDRVTIQIDPHVPADVGLDFTLEFWMKANAADNPSGSGGTSTCNSSSSENWIVGRIIIDRAIFDHDRHGEYGVAIFRSGNTATLAFGILKLLPNRPGLGLCGSRNVADGQWHHVAITRNGSSGLVQIWVDGTLDEEGNGPTGDISYENGVPSSAPPGSLQRDNFLGFGAEKFDADANRYPSYRGLLDDVRISNVVRYTFDFPRPTAPHPNSVGTVALYRFDEAGGTAIIDENGNRSPGVLRPPASRSTDTPFGGGTPSAGTLQFTSTTYSVNEGVAGGAQAITVTRSGGTSGAASVTFQVSDVTTTLNADYGLPAVSTLSWNDGDGANKTFNITVINDQSLESNETANLLLSAPSGATLGSPDNAVLTIVDDDTPQPGVIRFTSAAFAVAENGGTSMISAERVNGSTGDVSIAVATTAGGSATGGTDYTAASGTLNWANGEAGIKSLGVTIIDDTAVEQAETVALALSNPVGGVTVGNPSAATLTITDNDVAVPPPPSGGGSGGGSVGLATLLVLLRELARRHGSFSVDASSCA